MDVGDVVVVRCDCMNLYMLILHS